MFDWITSVQPGWFVVAAISALFLAWRVRVHVARFIDDSRRQRRLRRAMQGEEAATKMLRHAGFQIVDTQTTRDWEFAVDGEPVSVELRADVVVERNSERFVAEVKSGVDAPKLRNAATRRQLLEYRLAYDVDGILLVDVESGEVRRIDFPLPT